MIVCLLVEYVCEEEWNETSCYKWNEMNKIFQRWPIDDNHVRYNPFTISFRLLEVRFKSKAANFSEKLIFIYLLTNVYPLRFRCYIFISSFQICRKKILQQRSFHYSIHLHILYTPTLKSSFFNPSPLSTILVKVSKLYTECIKSTKSRGLLPAGSNSIERLEGVVHIPLIEVS